MTNEQCLTRGLQRSLRRLVLTVGTILLLEACATPDSAKTVVDAQHIHRIVGSTVSVIVTDVHEAPTRCPLPSSIAKASERQPSSTG